MSQNFVEITVVFPAPFGGRPETFQGEVSTDPAADYEAFKVEASTLLTAIKNKIAARAVGRANDSN